jgi:hypothetical protein
MAVEITDELETLRAEAEALGIAVDGRWGEARLRDEIAAAQPDSPSSVASDGDPPAPEGAPQAEDGESEPAVLRAGGHVDRGDGRGWMLEE